MRLIFILILIPVILVAQKYLVHPTVVKPEITHVAEVKSAHSPSNTPTASSTTTPNTTSIPTPTSQRTLTQTPSTQGNINDFLYPGATQTGNNGNSTNLRTSDDAQVVTNWYKDKIKSLGWNATSAIENNTNSDISNQLVASNGSREIRIQITKNNNSSTVNITVSM